MARQTNSTFLVFETASASQSAPDEHYHSMGQRPPRLSQGLSPYACLGAVNAPDSMTAVQAVMAHTRRISKFAVVECEIIDFQPGEFSEAEGKRVELNP